MITLLVALVLLLLINLGLIGGVLVRDMRRRKVGLVDFAILTAIVLTTGLGLAAIVLLLA